MAEYNALFFNADGVKEARKNRNLEDISKDDGDFNPEYEMERIRSNPLVEELRRKYSSDKNSDANYKSKIGNILDIT